MNTDFSPVRLREIRTRNNLSMAEAGRLLNMSKMGYCRYEYGDRVPSYQTIQYIAELMGTSYDYLCGLTDDPSPDRIVVSRERDPELYSLILSMKNGPKEMTARMQKYAEELLNQ